MKRVVSLAIVMGLGIIFAVLSGIGQNAGIWAGITLYMLAGFLLTCIFGWNFRDCTYDTPESVLEVIVGFMIPHLMGVLILVFVTFMVEIILIAGGDFPEKLIAPSFKTLGIFFFYDLIGFTCALIMRGLLLFFKEERFFLSISFLSSGGFIGCLTYLIYKDVRDIPMNDEGFDLAFLFACLGVFVVATVMGFLLKKDMDPNFKPKSEALPTTAQ